MENTDKTSTNGSDEYETVIMPLLEESPFRVIDWLQQNRLFKCNVTCDGCDTIMNWSKYSKAKDGYAWKCNKRDCPRYKSTSSIRTGSFLARSNMSLQNWVHIMYLWSQQTDEATAATKSKIPEKMVSNCYSFFREVCATYFLAKPVRLGGPGCRVEMSVSCFTDIRQQTGAPYSTTRVLGVVDASASPNMGYMEVITRTEPASILPVLQKVVRPGSLIYSDDWKTYRDIQGVEHTDIILDHSLNFVEMPKGELSQTMMTYWDKHRGNIKALRCGKYDSIKSYLQEYMWRDLFGENSLQNICQHIAAQYPM